MANNVSGLDKHQRAFAALVEKNSYSRHQYTVFKDFCELAALSMSNAVDRAQYEQREARYLEIVKSYKADEVARFPEMLSCLVLSLEGDMKDCLGQLYMALELGNSRAGQFFTPYNISLMMAKIICGDVKEQCKARGYVRVMEPAVGAGGMVIATAEAFADEGVNYQQALHATCIDIDVTAVHMAYVQLSLLNIPAIIIHGNALSNEQWGYWVTPAHVLGFWNSRLRRDATDDPTKLEEESGDCPAPGMPAIVSHQVRELVKATKNKQQLTLF